MIPGYTILDRIYSGSKTKVYRAIEENTNRPVVIKVLKDAHPSFEQLGQFRNQYTIARHLQHPQILETYRLEPYHNGYALVLEDFGGMSLREWIDLATSSLATKLQIAIDLTLALQELGQQRIIHKDINPANILIHPVTQQVKLIDFGIASLLPKETLEIRSPNVLEGTLAYIAPEQTGRMNRGIDYRSDFYSLGVTLFELFTGELPFHAEDPIGWVYCHLAQSAVSADRINPDLPVAVAQIIAKLMAKNAEDRYQTAIGITYDLNECLRQLQETGAVSGLTIGQRDLGNRFIIPEKLYGRESAVQTLLDAFDRVAQGSSELLLVAGCSGIGKTAVINEIHKPITRQRGYFIRGKFDQFNRNIPLSAFVRAFRDLIGQLLSESDAQLAAWKTQILTAVGENGRVLIEVIPELELIIGAQAPVAELTGTAVQSRFNLLFQRFIAIFASVEHPLTIFLDDLQWADAASLQLLQLLIEGKSYLLLLGAYRDNEVPPAHPLMSMLGELQQAQIVVSTITLAPLTFDDTNQLVADTLHCSIDRAKLLTESIDLKAHGNPLFITQFLKALHADGEIRFNPEGYWECDILKIQSLAITDDVVEFIAIQIQKLPMATQHILKLAACIGDKFDLDVLSIVSEQSELVTTALWNGLYAGLILPTSQIYKFNQDLEDLRDLQDCVVGVDRVFQIPMANSTYCFLHDRVQQAAYSLIPEDQKQQTHLQIGRLLLANTPPEQQSERLFEIVNHFNTATRLIQQPEEREMVAALNLLAAQKARAATAYAAAVSYARIGTQLLGKLAWQQQYQLALELHETLAETTFLNGDFEQVPALVDIVLARAAKPIDRVKAYETSIQCHVIQKQYRTAISQGLEILQQLGLKLAAKPNKLTLVRALLNTKVELLGKSHQKLVNLPETTDPKKIALLRILNHLIIPAFVCSQELMVILITSGTNITLRSGNTPWSAVFYATYGIIVASLGDFKQSYQMGKLAIELDDQFDNRSTTAKVNFAVAWFCQPWHQHLRHSKPLMDECIKESLESGNLTSLGLSYSLSMIIDFYLGTSLDRITEQVASLDSVFSQARDYSQEISSLFYYTVKNLRETSTEPTLLAGNSEEEIVLIDRLKNDREASALSTVYGLKTCLAYILADIPTALLYADAQLPYEHADSNCYSITQLWMFDALTRLAAYPQSDRRVQKQLLDRVKRTQHKLLKCARLMPDNFQHKYDLVEAEKCRVLGDFATAIELYDHAISGAKTHEFLQEEAISNECAARFYLEWGKSKIAAAYMQSAYYCYLRWGAKAKTTHLEQHYPQLLAPIFQAQQAEFNPLATLVSINDPSHKDRPSNQGITFDVASVIQAAQALSSTIELEVLIQQLSQIILQNSGAETCMLALPNLQDEWQIYQSNIAVKEFVAIKLSQIIVNSIEYPANLIYWIKNTQQSIIFDARQPLEIADLYLLEHQPQSVFCLPIVKQQQVLGVLYLEHRHAPAIFTDNTKTVISFLCTQAAIALDNANLYRESQQAAENIRLKQRDLETLLNDRQVMEIALRDSEERYHQLVSNIPAALYQFEMNLDGSYRINYVSARFPELFEVAAEAVLSDISVLLNRIVPADRRSFDRAIRKAAKLGNSWHWQGRISTPSGQIKWIRGESRHQPTTDGSIVWDGILLDVTEQQAALQEREQAEIALRQSESRFQKLADNIPGVIYQFRIAPDGKVTFPYISSGSIELFELEPAAIIADSNCLMQTIHPDDLSEFEQIVAASAQNMSFKLWEGRLILGSGTIKWIKSASRPELQPDGAIVWDGVMLDITAQQNALSERNRAAADLRTSQQKYYNLIQSINGVVWEYDLAVDRFSFVSDRAVALFGYPISDWLDQPNFWREHVYPEDLEPALRTYNDAVAYHYDCEFEYRMVAADGRVIWVYDISTLICDPDGNSIATKGLIIDITERKQFETKLQHVNERLELTNSELQRATRLKDEFLATMSHELRTPLNAILGMSEALQEEVFGALNDRQIKSISTIERSGEHLLSLINDILDVSKITAGKLELNIAEVSLSELCTSSLMFVKQQAFEQQIQIDTHLPADLESILVDRRRMCQVLINLLNNAIKFTPKGGLVTLSIWVKSPEVGDRADGYSLYFAIRDTGIGIASADIAKLFQPFIQVDSNLNRKYEGTGLGLVLVKQIVELHGGAVTIDSEVGTGSCFTVMLPQADFTAAEKSIDLDSGIDLTPAKIFASTPTAPLILLAEDNEVNISTFTSYLTAKGYRIILAQNGREAISMIHSQRPDLILMDIQMPELDGITAIKYIRQQFTPAQLPIIAISALAMEGDRKKCLAVGANEYLTKPVKLRELHYTIQECLDLN